MSKHWHQVRGWGSLLLRGFSLTGNPEFQTLQWRIIESYFNWNWKCWTHHLLCSKRFCCAQNSDRKTPMYCMYMYLHGAAAAVTFMDQSWFPHSRLAARPSLNSCYSCMFLCALCYWCNLFSDESAPSELLWISGYILYSVVFQLILIQERG